jgi:GH25 family lysozyme M1 (1,4-beta-N-acetylmuramidase)
MQERRTAGIRDAALLAAALAAGCSPGDHGAPMGSTLAPMAGGPDAKETTCPDGDTVFGIDVSYYQGTIDWDAVAADGVEFAFIRVSDGLGYPDSQFANNWQGAQAAGLLRGVYQFFREDEDPVDQAAYLLAQMGDLGDGDLPPVIDVESTDGAGPGEIVANVQEWIDHVEAATGRTPIVYTGKYFWQDNVGSTAFAGYPLWAAHYGVTCPDIADQWDDWTFWQYSSSGAVDGIAGDVDTNWFNGSWADLLALAESTIECDRIPAAGRIVEETEGCFVAGGDPQWWRYEDDGWEGTLMWTHATANAEVDNYGIWDLDFEEAGTYLLEAYTDGDFAESEQAGYLVRHAGAEETVALDQTAADGWQEIGEFDFEQGADQWVRLDDNTGEDVSLQRQIVYDGLRVTPVGGADTDTDSDADSDADADADGDSDECITIRRPADGCSFAPARPLRPGLFALLLGITA